MFSFTRHIAYLGLTTLSVQAYSLILSIPHGSTIIYSLLTIVAVEAFRACYALFPRGSKDNIQLSRVAPWKYGVVLGSALVSLGSLAEFLYFGETITEFSGVGSWAMHVLLAYLLLARSEAARLNVSPFSKNTF